jgi:carbonic anhydrase
MKHAKPLPTYLVNRFHGWKATQFAENRAWFARLADEGQRPRAMIISCCDSRVHVTSIFGADSGEFFIHRNIANLVPPFKDDEDHHGTSAAIEYAVGALHVANVIVLGHSGCGGVQEYYDTRSGNEPDRHDETSFVARWMDILRPGYERVAGTQHDRAEGIRALEREGVVVGLENLMTFPFVAKAVENGTLALHGLWNDIRDGGLEYYCPKEQRFKAV